jgi:uncharacterized protein (TIGR00369 family)
MNYTIEGRLAFSITEQTGDTVVSVMPVIPEMKNPYGVVHAGAILWFADVTATVLANGSVEAHEGMQGFPLAITLNASFIGNQKEGEFRAISSFVRKGKTVMIVRTTVTGAEGRIIADITTNHILAR